MTNDTDGTRDSGSGTRDPVSGTPSPESRIPAVRPRFPKPEALRGVLLDIDGTLLDSNDAHARSWVDVFHEFELDVPFDRVRPLIGMGGDKLLPTLTGIDAESERGQRLSARRKEIFRADYLPHLRPTRGAHDLVARLRADGLRLVVATSAAEDELRALLEQAGLPELEERSTTSDDAERSKPDPDIVHAALGRAGLSPEEALMVGDTPYDVEAAGRSRVGTIAVRCGGWWDDDALAAAAAIYDDPASLLEAYEGMG